MANPPLNPQDALDQFRNDMRSKIQNDPITLERLRSQLNNWSYRNAPLGNAGMQALGGLNTYVLNPVLGGLSMPYNPMDPTGAMKSILNIGTTYRSTLFQSRAFMGGEGRASVSDFDTSGIDRFAQALKSIGATRTDALQTMQALVSMSRQVSTSMSDATMAVMTFSKATGLDTGAVAGVVGGAALGSNRSLTGTLSRQLLGNVRNLAGNNNAMVLPMAQAVQGFREIQMQRGRLVTFDNRGVDNATNMMGSFLNLDRQFYGQRPDVAMRHMSQLQGVGQGAYLGIAMDVAARNGRPTDITSVMAAIQNGEEWMMNGLYAEASSSGMSDLSALLGVDAEFLLKGRRGGRLGGGYTPGATPTLEELMGQAGQATTSEDRQRARMLQEGEEKGAQGASFFSRALEKTPGWVGYGLGAVTLGAGMMHRKSPLNRMTRSFGEWMSRRGGTGDEILDIMRQGMSKPAGAEVMEEMAEQAGKRGLGRFFGKGALMGGKKIPFIGAAIGLGLGAYALAQGDYVGAVGEVASGAASTIPGAGTAASFAIDGALLARDLSRTSGDATSAAPGIMPTATATRPTWMGRPLVQATPHRDIFAGYDEGYKKLAHTIDQLMSEQDSTLRMGIARVEDSRTGRSSLRTYPVDARTGQERKDPEARSVFDAASATAVSRMGNPATEAQDVTKALQTLTTALNTLNTTLTTGQNGSFSFTSMRYKQD